MQEILENSKIEMKEVQNARRERITKKDSGFGREQRKNESDVGARTSQGHTVSRQRIQLPVHLKTGRPKQAVKLNRPTALSDFGDSI